MVKKMINIAITGKGGVGKTTVAGTLSRLLAREGYNVLAVDADPDMNLGTALGVDTSDVTPLTENYDLIAERAGAEPGGSVGGVFKLNPKVSDIADKYGIDAPDGVTLLLMGTVEQGGSGCMCPSDAFLRALLRHLIIGKDDAVVLDMEAGVEHLGRGTAKSVDMLIVVVEPGMKSIQTAERINKLAEDIDISDIKAVINKKRSEEDSELVREKLDEMGIPVIAEIPYNESFVKADLEGKPPLDYDEDSDGIKAIVDLEENLVMNTTN